MKQPRLTLSRKVALLTLHLEDLLSLFTECADQCEGDCSLCDARETLRLIDPKAYAALPPKVGGAAAPEADCE